MGKAEIKWNTLTVSAMEFTIFFWYNSSHDPTGFVLLSLLCVQYGCRCCYCVARFRNNNPGRQRGRDVRRGWEREIMTYALQLMFSIYLKKSIVAISWHHWSRYFRPLDSEYTNKNITQPVQATDSKMEFRKYFTDYDDWIGDKCAHIYIISDWHKNCYSFFMVEYFTST